QLGVELGTSRLFLSNRMHLSAKERTIRREMNFQDQRKAILAAQIERPIGGEIPQRIRDQFALVDLHAPHDMRAGTDCQLGAGVDGGMSELTQVAAIFAQERFVARRHVLMACAFRSAVERNDDYVSFSTGLSNGTQGVVQVQEVVSARIGGEGN